MLAIMFAWTGTHICHSRHLLKKCLVTCRREKRRLRSRIKDKLSFKKAGLSSKPDAFSQVTQQVNFCSSCALQSGLKLCYLAVMNPLCVVAADFSDIP